MPNLYDPFKLTLVIFNSFTTSPNLYRTQFAKGAIADRMRLLAIGLLRHGKTRTKSEHFAYCGVVTMSPEVMRALEIQKKKKKKVHAWNKPRRMDHHSHGIAGIRED